MDGPEGATLSKLMPVYPLTAKLYTWDLQKVISTALDLVTGVPDVFTPELRERFGLLGIMQALRWIHAPDDWSELGAAQKRFRFEEALVLQLVLARRRAAHRALGAQSRAPRPDGVLAAFDARLPFELTGGQREVGEVVADELARDHPMLAAVGWSWLTEALEAHGAGFHAASGTVTCVTTESFGGMAEEPGTAQVEIRASWTPAVDEDGALDMTPHVEAWGELMCTAVGLPPVPEGVTAIPSRRGQRGT
jgi:hypothetical protein